MSGWFDNFKKSSMDDILRELGEHPETMAKMTSKEAKEMADRMRSAANKRLKRLRKEGAMGKASPALREAEKALGGKGKKFSTKGKNRNQLLSEISKMKTFMASKTSTARGWRKVRESENKRIGIPKKWGERKRKRYWSLVNKAMDANSAKIKSIEEYFDSTQFQRYVRELVEQGKGMDEDAFMQKIEDSINSLYDSVQEGYEMDEDALEDAMNEGIDIDFDDIFK